MALCFSCFKEFEGGSVCPHCGQSHPLKPKEPIHLAPGTVLAGRYVLGQSVGAGGFGIVYRAFDTKLETVVAVKEFFVTRIMTRAVGINDVIVTKKAASEYAYRKERFLAEARNMARFSDHKSIPNVYEFFEENGTAYIVMELLSGITLNQYLKVNQGKVERPFALKIANEVGNALRSLHENGIIHRDVAPDNIFLCTDGEIRVKLMDLGAAKLADAKEDVVDIILKPGYSPVEQYDNSKNYGPQTDIYALGATLYTMLTGVKPDESTNRKIEDTLKEPKELDPEIPLNLNNAITRAMAVEQHMRFTTVDEFLQAINGEKSVLSMNEERKRRQRKKRIGIAAACLIALAGILIGGYSYISKERAETLQPATISVWYCEENGSDETDAMRSIKQQFEEAFEDVTVELTAFSPEEYELALEEAARNGELPDLFESTGISETILEKARDLDGVLASDAFKQALFLNQYDNYYSDHKQMPLAIEIPVAYVITNGPTAVEYTNDYFTSLEDFGGASIAVDEDDKAWIGTIFDTTDMEASETFLNNEVNTSAVLLASSMDMNKVRSYLLYYEKTTVFYTANEIPCAYTYEWSIGADTKNGTAAAEKLLSWMLDFAFQRTLMLDECQDGQLPVNEECFAMKLEAQRRVLGPVDAIYRKFVFKQ